MAYKIVLSAIAEIEFEDTVVWYEQRLGGLGLRFIESLNNCFTLISENPDIFSKKTSGFREAHIADFPYLVIYKSVKKKSEIRVFHIFHTKRNPAAKKS